MGVRRCIESMYPRARRASKHDAGSSKNREHEGERSIGMAASPVSIQAISRPEPSTPSWFGEVVLLVEYLRKHGTLTKLSEGIRFARKRFGRYEVIDFLAVLFGYAISGERTLEDFYERLQPFAIPFMALFERDRLPSRSAFSRFLAALTEEPVEALRTLFLDDLLSRSLTPDKQTGGLVDRVGNTWMVFDIDGTREAARQRALPQTDGLPPAFRRLDDVCAPGYRGRKRGEVVRTRTTVSQAHSYQWLGSFGNRGNGRYREELRKGLAVIGRYLAVPQFSQERTLLRLDGQYGNGAVLSDLAGFAFVTRGKDYRLLDHPLIQARLHLPPDQFQQRPESQMVRSLYDCPEIPVGPDGKLYRVVVATHPEGSKKSPIGITRKGIAYELFFTNLPQHAFTACDVVELYLHRGAFEPILSDEDKEQDPDRWCSHSAWGQEAWHVISQWTWNLKLELGHQLKPQPLRTTEFAPALPPLSPHSAPASGYAPPEVGSAWKAGRFAGQDFTLQPDGTLRCPADQKLTPHEQRREADGSPAISCMELASAVVVPVFCGSSASGRAVTPRSHARSACCCIRFVSVLHHFSGKIGPAENIGVPVSRSCGINVSTCACCLPLLHHPPRTRSSPGRSVRTRASHGLNGSPAMRVRKLLSKSRSRCLASQQTLPPHSVSRRLNFELPRRSDPCSRASWLLRVNPYGFVSRLGLTSSSLLPCLLSILSVWLDLPDSPAQFCMTFAYSSMINFPTNSLRIAWALVS